MKLLRTIVDDMVYLSVFSTKLYYLDMERNEAGTEYALDGSIHDLLWEIICADIASDAKSISTRSLDLSYHFILFLLIDTIRKRQY